MSVESSFARRHFILDVIPTLTRIQQGQQHIASVAHVRKSRILELGPVLPVIWCYLLAASVALQTLEILYASHASSKAAALQLRTRFSNYLGFLIRVGIVIRRNRQHPVQRALPLGSLLSRPARQLLRGLH